MPARHPLPPRRRNAGKRTRYYEKSPFAAVFHDCFLASLVRLCGGVPHSTAGIVEALPSFKTRPRGYRLCLILFLRYTRNGDSGSETTGVRRSAVQYWLEGKRLRSP
ncbi:hypothetical protein MRX96_019419 [Rhipicephalus microplus]